MQSAHSHPWLKEYQGHEPAPGTGQGPDSSLQGEMVTKGEVSLQERETQTPAEKQNPTGKDLQA